MDPAKENFDQEAGVETVGKQVGRFWTSYGFGALAAIMSSSRFDRFRPGNPSLFSLDKVSLIGFSIYTGLVAAIYFLGLRRSRVFVRHGPLLAIPIGLGSLAALIYTHDVWQWVHS